MIKFTIPIIPKAQARARSGRTKAGQTIMYTGSGQRQAQNDLVSLMAPYAPQKPLDGPLSITVDAYLSVPKSWSKRKQACALAQQIRPTSKPDLDNYLKQIMDCMTKLGFWMDDSQVVRITAAKKYGEKACWHVMLHEIN